MGEEIVGAFVLSCHGDISSIMNYATHINRAAMKCNAFHRSKMASIWVVYNEAVNVVLTEPGSSSRMRGSANIQARNCFLNTDRWV